MTTPWKKRLFRFLKKLVAILILPTVNHVLVLPKKNDRGIVKFSRRKDCQRVLSVKKNFKKLKMEDIGLTGDNKVFLNNSGCP